MEDRRKFFVVVPDGTEAEVMRLISIAAKKLKGQDDKNCIKLIKGN